jgi:hypothetical protein
MLGSKPENRPTAEKNWKCLKEYLGENKIVELVETKRKEIIKPENI